VILQLRPDSERLGVKCDQQGCEVVYRGMKWRDPTDLPYYTPRNVRRQARKRGWITVLGAMIAGIQSKLDVCPEHAPGITG
jgi:hypothetical protein